MQQETRRAALPPGRRRLVDGDPEEATLWCCFCSGLRHQRDRKGVGCSVTIKVEPPPRPPGLDSSADVTRRQPCNSRETGGAAGQGPARTGAQDLGAGQAPPRPLSPDCNAEGRPPTPPPGNALGLGGWLGWGVAAVSCVQPGCTAPPPAPGPPAAPPDGAPEPEHGSPALASPPFPGESTQLLVHSLHPQPPPLPTGERDILPSPSPWADPGATQGAVQPAADISHVRAGEVTLCCYSTSTNCNDKSVICKWTERPNSRTTIRRTFQTTTL